MKNNKTWCYKINNDELVELVLGGILNTIIIKYDMDSIPKINEESILVYSNERKACKIKINSIAITDVDTIDWDSINLIKYKKEYLAFLNDKNINNKVVIEQFRIVENYKQERLLLAKNIVNNCAIVNKISFIEELNVGFNNYLFDINNKYILKICANPKEEKSFDKEAKYYMSNKGNNNIPRLYLYDNSKDNNPYVYEIIEKINGSSVYYYWYKWNESQKEEFIKKLMDVLKIFHSKKYKSYDWANKLKKEAKKSYNKCYKKFSKDEQKLILKSLNKYDELLSDNYFTLIHNDLHFDNIIIDNNNNIKLIDFNDIMIAPFDYDLRLLFMSQKYPWKWANAKMDPYQKPKDYENIINYIKKYYEKLNSIKYLEQRMAIYNFVENIKSLETYNNKELINEVVNSSKIIIDL